MKKSRIFIPLSVAVLLASGCTKTNDYTPVSGVSGADIFKATCAECHEEAEPKIFALKGDDATSAAVQAHIENGNFVMPKYPNIQGEELVKLTEYVLKNNEKN